MGNKSLKGEALSVFIEWLVWLGEASNVAGMVGRRAFKFEAIQHSYMYLIN